MSTCRRREKNRPRVGKALALLSFVFALILGGANFSRADYAPTPSGPTSTTPSPSDSISAAHFEFVPFPCPSLKYYEQAQAFMDQVCAAASAAHVKVIIIRSCYNDAANLSKKDWWGEQIDDLPNHYKKYIDDGTVKLVDQDSALKFDATPCGFFFRDNKTVWTGILTEDDPATALDLITKKPADIPAPATAAPALH